LNKSVQTGDIYTQTLITYDTPEDAKLTTTPITCKVISCTNHTLLDKNQLYRRDSNDNQQ